MSGSEPHALNYITTLPRLPSVVRRIARTGAYTMKPVWLAS